MAHEATRSLNVLSAAHALRELRTCLAVGAFAVRCGFVHEANLEVFACVGMKRKIVDDKSSHVLGIISTISLPRFLKTVLVSNFIY